MRSYAQYCPVAKASEILGDRWTLLIVRELLGGASGFNELQRGLPGISRSVLTDRMRALERAEVVERRTGPKGRTLEYRLTTAGRDLQPVVQAIGEWGVTWSFTEPRPDRVYLGRAELGGAIQAGQLTMSGPRALQRGFGRWFTWSPFAPAGRSAQERRTAASGLAGPHRVRIAEARPGSAPPTD